MDRQTVIKTIEESKIIVILRGFTTKELIDTVSAIRDGGIRCCEITYDITGKTKDEDIASQIGILCERFPDMCIGAGTVLTKEQVVLTKAAGGKFIISPDTNEEVIKETVASGLVSLPGAFTPSEATLANRCGADFVKLFPNSEVKPSYLKALVVPLSHIRFLAVGGVTLDNITDYLKNGAKGVGIATAIADKKLIASGEFDKVRDNARLYADAVASFNSEV